MLIMASQGETWLAVNVLGGLQILLLHRGVFSLTGIAHSALTIILRSGFLLGQARGAYRGQILSGMKEVQAAVEVKVRFRFFYHQPIYSYNTAATIRAEMGIQASNMMTNCSLLPAYAMM